MGRFFLVLILAVGLCLGAASYFGWFPDDALPAGGGARTAGPAKFGAPLYKPFTVEQKSIDDVPAAPGRSFRDALIVHDCHLNVIDKVDVSAAREGVLIFIGKEVDQESPHAKGQLDTHELTVGGRKHELAFVRWNEGDTILKGEMIGVVDPTRALNDRLHKRAKIELARAEHKAAVATFGEAQSRLDRLTRIRERDPRAVAEEEYNGAVLTSVRHREDSRAKEEQVKLAEIEYQQSEADLRQHEIRNVLDGKSVIKVIYKNKGEGVRDLEPVVRLENYGRLRVEGLADSQYFDSLRQTFDKMSPEKRREKLRVIVEPVQEMAPEPLNKAHRGEINAVAVCPDPKNPDNPRFVSGSEDRTACVWRRNGNGSPEAALRLPPSKASPVRSVACAARDGKSWCLTGCADGTIYVWDLDNPSAPVHELRGQHQDAVTALAFTHDGKYFASGGQDNQIVLWDAALGKALYPFDHEHGVDSPHQGTVTQLHFTPRGKLVSAGRDNTLRVWSVGTEGAKLDGEPVGGRGGAVTHPGVSADGALMVFDQGRTLQMFSTDKLLPGAKEIQAPPSATAFETLAIFSPDGATLLTAGGGEGRMQLWRAPGKDSRAYELRQLVSQDRTPTTCAAFEPGRGRFIVSGTKDGHVHLWAMPSAEELKAHRIHTGPDGHRLTLANIDRSLESGKVRVTAVVTNPEGRLAPGRRVTVVVELEP